MTDILDQICKTKRTEIVQRKAETPLSTLDERVAAQSPPRGFRAALEATSRTGFGLIAEIKKASPSKGLIREEFDPVAHARAYCAGGATCLSVLTDAPYFQGSEEYLTAARDTCDLPVLRKDFMLDPWQAVESRAIGADAILLIVAALEDGQMAELAAAATALGMDFLVEVHDEAELDRARALEASMIGINNRNLRSFVTDLAVTERLAALAPDDCLLVAESGIAEHDDLERLANGGVRCFLVGESLMRQADVEAATRMLLTGRG